MSSSKKLTLSSQEVEDFKVLSLYLDELADSSQTTSSLHGRLHACADTINRIVSPSVLDKKRKAVEKEEKKLYDRLRAFIDPQGATN